MTKQGIFSKYDILFQDLGESLNTPKLFQRGLEKFRYSE
jgi:hypothetical protein